MKFLCALCALCALCGLVVPALSLDREAFTFTHYDLNVRIEPEQQRLAVRGKIALRNESAVPQKLLVLQISSSLGWRSIRLKGEPLDFESQKYTSDVDHSGALSEAVVSLPQALAPKATIELDIGYEGTITLDTTRLTRIGVPAETAKHTDWDQIGVGFTAVRGVGYVTWYPVAMQAASLSDGNAVEEESGRWKGRCQGTEMSVRFEVTNGETVWFSGTPSRLTAASSGPSTGAQFVMQADTDIPTFVIGDYQTSAIPKTQLEILSLPGNATRAAEYADAILELAALVPYGRGAGKLQVLELTDPQAAPFVSGSLVLMPFASTPSAGDKLTLMYALGRRSLDSPRAWIREGLAHYAQAWLIEHLDGHTVALRYLEERRDLLAEAEKRPAETGRSVVNAGDGLYVQTKAMFVWWMLRDLVGETALKSALSNYRAADDKEPSYIQRLIAAQTNRDLEWFFDDWVYRDKGLPDFRVTSVYPRKIVQGGYLVTVTVENLGAAGAEVPVTVRSPSGDVTKRLEVHAKAKNSIRVEVGSAPEEVVVNDGSVPESDVSNNSFKAPTAESP